MKVWPLRGGREELRIGWKELWLMEQLWESLGPCSGELQYEDCQQRSSVSVTEPNRSVHLMCCQSTDIGLWWRKAQSLLEGALSSVVQSWPTVCNPMDHSTPGLPVHHQLPELAQIHVHRVGDAIQQSHPLSSPSPPAFNLSRYQGLYQWVSSLHQGPKYWSFSFSISPFNEYSGLISFMIAWFDLLAVQGTLKSFLEHHSSKVSILQNSAFCMVQLSHPYITTGKTIALTRRTFVGKVMSLFFNMLSSLVIAFLPRSKVPYIESNKENRQFRLKSQELPYGFQGRVFFFFWTVLSLCCSSWVLCCCMWAFL